MKWAFLIVLVLVAGAVAGFAIYTWSWRETGGDQQGLAKAQAYAHVAAALCTQSNESEDPSRGLNCTVADVTETAFPLYKVTIDDPYGSTYCVTVDVESFARLESGFRGLYSAACYQ